MSIIVVLIGISLAIAIVFLVIFYWSMKSGQYDDTYTPSVRILFDQKPTGAKKTDDAAQRAESSRARDPQKN